MKKSVLALAICFSLVQASGFAQTSTHSSCAHKGRQAD